MNKKALTVFALIIIVAGVSAVSAIDLSDLIFANNSEQASIGGINFTIPNGYEEVESEFMNQTSADFSIDGYTTEGKAFLNNETDVEIVVTNYTNNTELKEQVLGTGNKTTIAGIEGYSNEIEDSYIFTYEDNDCIITIATNDKNVIPEFITA